LEGEAEDFAAEQVADLDGDVLNLGETGVPGHAIGAVGMADNVFGRCLEGGCQRIQELRWVLPRHELAPQEVMANRIPDIPQVV
jgi:hypothetical protein